MLLQVLPASVIWGGGGGAGLASSPGAPWGGGGDGAGLASSPGAPC